MMSILLVLRLLAPIIINLCLLFGNRADAQCQINDPDSGFYRLGQSRFYVKIDRNGFSSNLDASNFCKGRQLRLASVNDLTESVFVGRELEALTFKQRQLRNNLFYLNARYDETKGTYVWQQTGAPVQYQNILYFPPNELGKGQMAAFPNKTLCLVLGSPFPVSENAGRITDIYGWSTSMIEWPCALNVGKRSFKRFKLGALCETADPQCDKILESSYDLDQNSYRGLFPLANRRFVLSWDQMNQEEAVNFCMNYQLSLYTPSEGDNCLLPYIKDHWPDVTTTYFWTSAKYNKQQQVLKFEDGTEKPLKLTRHPPSGDSDEDTCTTMSYTNEKNDQMMKCKCRWNMMVQAVTNCNMPAGVICQHSDFASRACLRGPDGKLAQEFVTPIGDPQNKYFRSVRKQDYKKASAKCKELKYEMVSQESELFQGSFILENLISYDLQTYWVTNPQSAMGGPECPVANLEGKQGFSEAVFETRKCVEKNFFLCENKFI